MPGLDIMQSLREGVHLQADLAAHRRGELRVDPPARLRELREIAAVELSVLLEGGEKAAFPRRGAHHPAANASHWTEGGDAPRPSRGTGATPEESSGPTTGQPNSSQLARIRES